MNAWRLPAELLLRRHGMAACLVAPLLAAAVLIRFGLLPDLKSRVAAQEEALAAFRTAATGPHADKSGSVILEQRLQAFRSVLVPGRDLSSSIAAIIAEGERQGLRLALVDYKRGALEAGGYQTIQLRLPVRGPYPQVRRFAEELLHRMPGLAIEEIALRRERIDAAEVDATLRVSLHFAGDLP